MPALHSVSSGVMMGSGGAGEKADSSAGAIQPTTEKLLAAVRAEIGHTVGRSRIQQQAGPGASLYVCGVERRSSPSHNR